MDALVAYGSGSEESDNKGEQKQATIREEGDISKEISVSETSTIRTTIMDLPPSSRVPLPLELNCEIFKCLKLPIQRKFIWGMGRDIYGIFGQKLLKKTKRVRKHQGNRWDRTKTRATIAENGLNVRNKVGVPAKVFAEQPFPTSGPQCRVDGFPGTILYYYEVNTHLGDFGLSNGPIPDDNNFWICDYSNSYAISRKLPISTAGFYLYECRLAGEPHHFELPEGVIQPRPILNSINVYGCGLVLDPKDKLWIFFTLNGKLVARKTPISPTVDRLFTTVCLFANTALEANFGDDPAKPFEYDIHNCPGLELACI